MNVHMQCQEVLPTQAGATAVGNVAHGVQATGATAANAAQAIAGRRRLHDAVVEINPNFPVQRKDETPYSTLALSMKIPGPEPSV